MSSFYAMQRANGDWFAVKDEGRLRVPVFRSNREAMQARARNFGMMLFRPIVFDERALNALTSTDEGDAGFWLVSNPEVNLNRGRPLERAQLALLIRDSMQPSRNA
jgi:hypothetical protein